MLHLQKLKKKRSRQARILDLCYTYRFVLLVLFNCIYATFLYQQLTKTAPAIQEAMQQTEGYFNRPLSASAGASRVEDTPPLANFAADNKTNERVTIVIMTYKRVPCLLGNPTLTEIVPLNIVEELIIIWNDVEDKSEVPQLLSRAKELGIADKVRIYYPVKNSMNNRYLLPLNSIATKAVFYLDDEWTMNEENFKAGFELWKKQPYRYVGYLPRGMKYDAGRNVYIYLAGEYDSKTLSLEEAVKFHGYNMVLPGGGLFIHTDYLRRYQSKALEQARDYIDKVFNCDDLLLNFIVPEEFQPPLLLNVNGNRSYQYQIDNKQGLSINWRAHVRNRERCVRKMHNEFSLIWPKQWSFSSVSAFKEERPYDLTSPKFLPSPSTTTDFRKKYFVGCNPQGWKSYVRPEYYFMYQGLLDTHDWTELMVSELTKTFMQSLKESPPIVILFCENHVENLNYFPVKELQRNGTQFAVYSDDTHMYNRFNPTEMVNILANVDVLVSTYAYRLDQYFRKLVLPEGSKLPKFLWLPHSASPAFTAAPINEKPIHKIFLSGSIGMNAYPIREWLRKTFLKRNKKFMIDYRHPGYTSVPLNQSDVYATSIRAHFCSVTTTMINRRLIAKAFEIPATGSLLLINLDLEPMLAALGMINMKHYVGFDNNNPETMIWWVLDPKNLSKVNKIRSWGMQVVRERHKTSDRSAALDSFFVTGVEPYPYPKFEKNHPCPMIGYKSEAECKKYYRNMVLHYDHKRPKNQPFPYLNAK